MGMRGVRGAPQRVAENTIILSAVETLQARGATAFGATAPLFGWRAEPDGVLSAAFTLRGRTAAARRWAGQSRPGLHPAVAARPRFRRRGDGRPSARRRWRRPWR